VLRVRIDEVLRQHGKSRYWLAKETKLTPLTISNLANGKTGGIEFATLSAICEALNCQPGELLIHLGSGKKKKNEQ